MATPKEQIISSDRLWPALAAALGLTEEQQRKVARVEMVLEPRAAVAIKVVFETYADQRFERMDWPQFDPSQITIEEQV